MGLIYRQSAFPKKKVQLTVLHLEWGSDLLTVKLHLTFVFQVQGEIQEIVKTGLWVGDCFIYTSSVNRLNYYVGGEIVTIAHLDRYKYRWFSRMLLKIQSTTC